MGYKRLFIWVEGGDDIRFFNRIIKPVLEEKYDWVEVRSYATLKREKVDSFLRSIKAMRADYIYVADIDDVPCIRAKKQGMQDKLKDIDEENIAEVIKEVESWYLAGLDDADRNLRIRTLSNTDNITKEQFNSMIPKTFYSRIDFMLEILKYFSIQMAKRKNKSFRYFMKKHNHMAPRSDGNGG